MRNKYLLVCMVITSVLVTNITLLAYGELSEELLFMEIPKVFSASKMVQPITEAPSAIYVITAKDIEQSGAIDIADLLRMVPGLEIPLTQLGTYGVTARGFAGGVTDRMLTIIDGRSVYMDFIGITLWDAIANLYLKDIERIEIIKGAGSALYGANAFSGVINIYTKAINTSEKAEVSITGGELQTYNAGLIHANMLNKWGYKIVASGSSATDWIDTDELQTTGKGYIKTEHILGDESRLFLSGGINNRTGNMLGTEFMVDNLNSYFQVDYNKNDLKVIAFYNNISMDIKSLIETDVDYAETYNGEIQNTLNWTSNNSLVYGCSYRYLTVKVNLDNQFEHNLHAVYLQNNYKFSDKTTLLIGGRYDYHSIIGGHTTPRIVLMYFPLWAHTLRLSYSEAFRDPTSMDLFSNFEMDIPGSELLVPGGLQVSLNGNKDIDPEKIKSVELGYRATVSRKVNTTIDLFFNKLEGMLDKSITEYQLLGPMSVPKTIYTTNVWNADAYGGEIGLNFFLNEWMKSFFNYSYQYITDTTNDVQHLASPEYKFNLGIRCKFDNGITANLLTHYVGKTIKYADYQLGIATPEEIDSYILINAGLGYQANNNMKLFIYVFDLLNNKHTPHSISNEVCKRITGTISYKF